MMFNSSLEKEFETLSIQVAQPQVPAQNGTITQTTLLDLLSQYPICDALCTYLDTPGLLSLKKLSKSLQKNISSHANKRWDINKRLGRFFEKPLAFRAQMRKHNALISGSFVIQFFEDLLWEESDLDIYLAHADEVSALSQYLIQSEGYHKAQTEPPVEPYFLVGVAAARTYLRGTGHDERKVQLIRTNSTPIQAILNGFYTTAVINAISWNTAYSMFPYYTFIRRTTWLMSDDDRYNEPVQKYEQRGWRTLIPLTDGDVKMTLEQRHVGDSQTWKIPLNCADIEPEESIPDFVIENAHFDVKKTLREGPCYCNAESFRPPILKYTYTHPGRRPNFWWHYMTKELDRLTLEQLEAMPVEDQPNWLAGHPNPGRGHFVNHGARFTKPAYWKYYDHMVPQWLEDWKGVRREDGSEEPWTPLERTEDQSAKEELVV